jgi:hypothetical protein
MTCLRKESALAPVASCRKLENEHGAVFHGRRIRWPQKQAAPKATLQPDRCVRPFSVAGLQFDTFAGEMLE